MDQRHPKGEDRRRYVRINTTFCVDIVGLDQAPRLRRGNISISGVFFETDLPVGPPGTVYRLRLGAEEGHPPVEVLARLVRVVSLDDISTGRTVVGAAFEFLMERDVREQEIMRLVRRVAEIQMERSSELGVEYAFRALVDRGEGEQKVKVVKVGFNGMLMKTDWPVKVGEIVQVAIETQESKKTVHLRGRAIKSRPDQAYGRMSYSTEVLFIEDRSNGGAGGKIREVAGTYGFSISDTIQELLSETIGTPNKAPERKPVDSFRGTLDTIQLTSLLGFLEMGRISGKLSLSREDGRSVLYIREGQLIDVTSDPNDREPREILRELIGWREGSFHFAASAIDHQDRIGMRTSALLRELAD